MLSVSTIAGRCPRSRSGRAKEQEPAKKQEPAQEPAKDRGYLAGAKKQEPDKKQEPHPSIIHHSPAGIGLAD